MKKTSAGASAPGSWGAWPAMAPFGSSAGSLLSAGSTYLEAVSEFNRECAKFVTTRLEHDADLGRELSQCRSWEEALQVQQDWLAKASEEYLAETQQLMALGSRVLSSGVSGVDATKDQGASAGSG